MSHPLKMSHPALAHLAFSCKWQHEKGLAAFFSLCQPITSRVSLRLVANKISSPSSK